MATTATTVRLNKKKCESGMDGLEFALVLEGMDDISFDEETLPNKVGKSIVKIKCNGGRISGSVNAVHCIRNTNEKPFSLVDGIKMELVRCQVFEYIRKRLKEHLQGRYEEKYVDNLKVTSLEVNVTLPCVGKATPSDMEHFLLKAFGKSIVYTDRKPGTRCGTEYATLLHNEEHRFRVKAYNKAKQLGNDATKKNLFRLEIIFIDRELNGMFGKDGRTLKQILSTKALDIMCRRYKSILDEITERWIRPYLNNCVMELFESLTYSDSGNEISDTIMRHKDEIVSIECLRKALKKWYRFRGVEDHSKQMIHKYRNKNLGLPEDVLQTYKAFHLAAG